jgi:hypothetical protein
MRQDSQTDFLQVKNWVHTSQQVMVSNSLLNSHIASYRHTLLCSEKDVQCNGV